MTPGPQVVALVTNSQHETSGSASDRATLFIGRHDFRAWVEAEQIRELGRGSPGLPFELARELCLAADLAVDAHDLDSGVPFEVGQLLGLRVCSDIKSPLRDRAIASPEWAASRSM